MQDSTTAGTPGNDAEGTHGHTDNEFRLLRLEMVRLRKALVTADPCTPTPGDAGRLALHVPSSKFAADVAAWCNDDEITPVTDWFEAVYLVLREDERSRKRPPHPEGAGSASTESKGSYPGTPYSTGEAQS